jgi:aminoglycoside phosphotransferase (APT) family kinase protein
MDMLPDRVIAPEVLAAIAARHGLGERPFAPLASTGIINTIWSVGNDLILRVPRNSPEGLADTFTESVAVPVAVEAGVRTPALVVWDESYELLDVPYAIYERVHAETLGLLDPDPRTIPQVYIALGHDLALLHSRVTACPDPVGRLDTPGHEQTAIELEQCIEAGLLVPTHARWLRGVIERLQPALAAAVPPRFVHNDLHSMNIMIGGTPLGYTAIIDWGDAGWGDPAVEFNALPLRLAVQVLAGYRAAALLPEDPGIEARMLWDRLGHGLRYLHTAATRDQAAGGYAPITDWLDLLRFMASSSASPWAELLGDVP